MTPRGADVDRYFYPRPPRGGRQLSTSDMAQGRRFLSTPSARRATVNSFNVYIDGVFLSTPSARRATFQVWPHLLGNPISIHALREEGDIQRRTGAVAHRISIHALREEGDPCQPDHRAGNLGFLSTPSARRATIPFSATLSLPMYFYPRPPRGGRPLALQHTVPHKPISIHALREEGDVRRSHHSCRSRISIHALREEGDLYFWPFVSR